MAKKLIGGICHRGGGHTQFIWETDWGVCRSKYFANIYIEVEVLDQETAEETSMNWDQIIEEMRVEEGEWG